MACKYGREVENFPMNATHECKGRGILIVYDLDNDNQHYTACLTLLQWFRNSYLMGSAEDFFYLTNIDQTRNTVFKSSGENNKYFCCLKGIREVSFCI